MSDIGATEQPPRPIRGLDSVVGDFAGVTAARVVTLVLGLLTVVLTARILSPEGYAVIAYMTLGGTLLMFVASGWSGAAVMRYGREELDRTGSMRRSTWARAVLTIPSLVVVGALLPALKLAGVLPGEFTWPYIWLTLALGLFFVAGEQLQVVLDAAGRMRLSAAAAAARQGLLVAGLAAIAFTQPAASTRTVAWLTVAAAGGLVVALALALGGMRLWPPLLDRVQLRRILVFSLPLVAFAASQYGMRSVDIIVLRAYGTAQDVGIYALAYQSYMTLQTLAVTITIVLIPLFVSLRGAGREDLVGHYFERLVPQATLVASVLGGLLAALVVAAVPVVFGSEFADAARPLALLVAALVLFSIASLLAPILMLHERTRETSLINIAALVVNLVGDVVLVGILDVGIVGPALATIAALAVIVGGYLVVARHDLRSAPVCSPALVAPLAAGLIAVVLLDGAWAAAAGVVATAAAAALVLWRLTLFTERDADLLGRLDLPPSARASMTRVIRYLARD